MKHGWQIHETSRGGRGKPARSKKPQGRSDRVNVNWQASQGPTGEASSVLRKYAEGPSLLMHSTMKAYSESEQKPQGESETRRDD